MPLQEEFESQGNYLFKHRGTFPIIILIVGFFVFLQPIYFTDHYWWTETFRGRSMPISVCWLLWPDLAIRCYTVGHTPANTSGRNTEGQLADTLNTSGIDSTVRHPLYLGNFFMWLGPATANSKSLVHHSIHFCLLGVLRKNHVRRRTILRKKFPVRHM
jgi:protein-S-isoprenylcysteine O-methyltransferase Ste14